MSERLRGPLIAGCLALAAAVLAFFILPDRVSPGERDIWKAAIALGIAVAVFFTPRVVRWLAYLRAVFAVYGLRQWAERTKGTIDGDPVWEWFTDQLLAAQRRYATSVGCIAFERSNGTLRCLLMERQFEGFDHDVLLWPGGRFRGGLEDLETELKDMVLQDTGCAVELLSVGNAGPFSSRVLTYNPKTHRTEIPNQLFAAPLFVMQQNRKQSHGVPGHVDFVFLGRIQPKQQPNQTGRLIDVSRLETENSDQRLWHDTRECIERAAQAFNNLEPPVQPDVDPPSSPEP